MVCLALVVGCGKKRVAATGETRLALTGVPGKEATFHDWGGKVKPCDVDPKVLAGDLESTVDLVAEYLAKTAPATEGAALTDEQTTLLIEGAEKLPPLLDATDKALTGVTKCKFTKEEKIGDLSNKAVGPMSDAGNRIAQAPALAEKLKAKQVLKAWQDKLPAARDAAKAEWCPTKLKAGAQPDIYFSFESETGATEWLFCDDSRVIAASGSPPAFEAAAALKKKPKDKPYLDSASKYPASDVQHPPKPGDKPPESPADGGTPAPAEEPKDAGT